MHDGKVTVFNARQGLSSDSVRSITEDHNGYLWVGTDGGGLNRIKDGRITVFGLQQGLPNQAVFAIRCRNTATS
jgi:ligand-binding sensor domain-containing protein